MLGQDTWGNLIHLADEFEHGVLWKLAECELSLGNVAGVSLSKNSVTITRHNAAGVKRLPKVFGDALVAQIVAHALLHLGKPVEHFLVSPAGKVSLIVKIPLCYLQSVERAGKSVQASGKR